MLLHLEVDLVEVFQVVVIHRGSKLHSRFPDPECKDGILETTKLAPRSGAFFRQVLRDTVSYRSRAYGSIHTAHVNLSLQVLDHNGITAGLTIPLIEPLLGPHLSVTSRMLDKPMVKMPQAWELTLKNGRKIALTGKDARKGH